MSENLFGPEKRSMPRVIKSHLTGGVRPLFPDLNADFMQRSEVPGPIVPLRPAVSPLTGWSTSPTSPALPDGEALRTLEQAREAELRARLLEQRAAAVLQEAEEVAVRRRQEAEARVSDMLERASEALERVQREAAEQGYTEGHERGYEAGFADGQAAAQATLAESQAQAEVAAEQAQHQMAGLRQEALAERDRFLDAAGDQILDLAFAIARQVLRAELAMRPEALVPMLEAALTKLKGEEEPQVRVSPQVLSLLDEHRGRLLQAAPGARKVELLPDPGLSGGDFVIHGSQGYIDGRIDRQVGVIEDEVRLGER